MAGERAERSVASRVERIRSHLGPLWGLTRLAPSPLLGARNGLLVLLMPLLQSQLQRRGRVVAVALRVNRERRDFFVDCMGDLQVLYEVWSWAIYDVPPLATATTVVDVGANIGAAVAFFKSRRPRAIVHAYEPDPNTFRKLERNVARLSGVVLHQAAIGAVDDRATLFSSPNSWDSSLIARAGSGIDVRCLRLQTARHEAGIGRIDLLKIDAEGAEFDVLEDHDALDGVAAIVAELHFDLVPGKALAEVLDACAGFRATVTGDSSGRMTMLAMRPTTSAARASA
jgi:FkbM family methyltransferase